MKEQLVTMLRGLNNYKRDKTTLMTMYVSERLEKSFNEYDKELKQSIDFLAVKHEKSILKRMKKNESCITYSLRSRRCYRSRLNHRLCV